MRVSYFGSSALFFGFSVLTCFIPTALDTYSEPYYITFWIYFCAASLLSFAVICARYFVLTTEGIQSKIFGIRLRYTPWQDIQDIMCVYHQTGERGAPKSLVFTTKTGRIYRPDKSGYIKEKGFLKACRKGDIIMIRCGKKYIAEAISVVEIHYGSIDYDFFRTGDDLREPS